MLPVGTIKNDYKLIGYSQSNKFIVRCEHCGYKKNLLEDSFLYAKGCTICRCRNPEYEKEKEKEKEHNPNREITKTTLMVVCLADAEGMSIKEIALLYKRTPKICTKIIKECKENGMYQNFINNCPFLQMKGEK